MEVCYRYIFTFLGNGTWDWWNSFYGVSCVQSHNAVASKLVCMVTFFGTTHSVQAFKAESVPKSIYDTLVKILPISML